MTDDEKRKRIAELELEIEAIRATLTTNANTPVYLIMNVYNPNSTAQIVKVQPIAFSGWSDFHDRL